MDAFRSAFLRIVTSVMLVLFMIVPVSAVARDSSFSSDVSTTRIVSLVPNLTELAFAIGAGDEVVGVSDFCRYPAEARGRPSVGGLINPGLEATLALRPDAVLLYRSQTDFASRLKTLHITPELFQVDTMNDLYGAIDRLGAITGRTSTAASLALNIRSALRKISRSNRGTTSSVPLNGIVIVSRDPAGLRSMYQAADGNFLGELFEIAGGRLAIPSGTAVSREDIIRANPDIIIDISVSAGASDVTVAMPRRDTGPWSSLTTVKAVKNGNVFQWNNAHAQLLGPSVVNTATGMNRIINIANRNSSVQ